MSIHFLKFVPEVIIEKSICIGFASGGTPKLFSRKVPKLSYETVLFPVTRDPDGPLVT